MTPLIRAAATDDLPRIHALLTDQGLPVSDLDGRAQFLVACAGAAVIGAGAIEPYGETALLRSVVVAPSWQGRGLGHRLVKALELQARGAGLTDVVLLTETARAFFVQLGYWPIERTEAPAPVRASAEFRALCPASAVCLLKTLR